MINFYRKVNFGLLLSVKIWFLLGFLGSLSYKDTVTITIEPPCGIEKISGRIYFNRFIFESEGLSYGFVRFKGVYFKYGKTIFLIGKSNDGSKNFPSLFRKIVLERQSLCTLSVSDNVL